MQQKKDPLIGQVIAGRYRVLSLIGKGGMGNVYKARQTYMDQIIALKVLRPDQLKEVDYLRFAREVKNASRVQHPNAIHIHDSGETEDGMLYMAMELVRGKSLGQMMKHYPDGLKLTTVNHIVGQICDALTAVHEQGIIHRDLKPENIMLCQDRDKTLVVKVLDFGISRARENTSLTQVGKVVGTPKYMSPEQGMGEKLDPRSDIYSLGLIIYEMLTGKGPFKSRTPMGYISKHNYSTPQPPRTYRKEIPQALEKVILKSIEKKPQLRYQSIAELKRAIALAIVGEKTPGPLIEEPASAGNLADIPDMPVVEAGEMAPPPDSAADQYGESNLSETFDIDISDFPEIPQLGKSQRLTPPREPRAHIGRGNASQQMVDNPVMELSLKRPRRSSKATLTPLIVFLLLVLSGAVGYNFYWIPLQEKERMYEELITMADSLLVAGDYEGAKIKYQVVLMEAPENIYVKTRLNEASFMKFKLDGDAYFQSGNYILAKTHYEAALDQKPGDSKIEEKIRISGARISGKAISARNERLKKLTSEANQLLQQKRYAEAQSKFSKATALDPGNAQLREREAICRTRSQIVEGMALIPGGWFDMGGDGAFYKIYLSPFYMDRTEVTIGEYRKFCDDTGRRMPIQPSTSGDRHPVVNVSWFDAHDYAQWCDKRLPTEAEWECAARGGLGKRNYPWGNSISAKDARFAGADGSSEYAQTAPVASYATNGYDLYDMAGNVMEWCNDWYAGGIQKDNKNPSGPPDGTERILRGGSWYSSKEELMTGHRDHLAPEEIRSFIGFRCAAD